MFSDVDEIDHKKNADFISAISSATESFRLILSFALGQVLTTDRSQIGRILRGNKDKTDSRLHSLVVKGVRFDIQENSYTPTLSHTTVELGIYAKAGV